MTDNPITRRERAGQFLALLDRVDADGRARELTMYDPEATDSAQELWSDAGALAALLRAYIADQDEADHARRVSWVWRERATGLRAMLADVRGFLWHLTEPDRNGPYERAVERVDALLKWCPEDGEDDPEAHPGGVAFVQRGVSAWDMFDSRTWGLMGAITATKDGRFAVEWFGKDHGEQVLDSLDAAQAYAVGCAVLRRDRPVPEGEDRREGVLHMLYHDPDACTCAKRSWYGAEHDGACPIGAAAHALGLDPKGPAAEAEASDD